MTAKNQPIKAPECANIILDIVQFFWETSLDAPSLMRQQALWYEVLKEHSLKTIQAVATDWLKNAKRKPTPADFLELANEIDPTINQIKRLKIIAELPIETPKEEYVDDGKMNGCPIILAKIMKFAIENKINFWEGQQMDCLRTGVIPDWYRPTIDKVVKEGPTREELLATMSPEARLAAIKPAAFSDMFGDE